MEARGSNRIFFTISHGSINRDNITVLFRGHGRERAPLGSINRFPLWKTEKKIEQKENEKGEREKSDQHWHDSTQKEKKSFKRANRTSAHCRAKDPSAFSSALKNCVQLTLELIWVHMRPTVSPIFLWNNIFVSSFLIFFVDFYTTLLFLGIASNNE